MHSDTILLAVQAGLWQVVGVQVVLQLYPNVRAATLGSVRRVTYWALGLVALKYTVDYIETVGTFGPKLTAEFLWPVVAVWRLIVLPGFFIDRIGLFALIAWSGLVFSFITMRLWTLAHCVQDLLGQPDHSFVLWVAPMAILCIYGAYTPLFGPDAVSGWVLNYLDPWSWVIFLGWPASSLILAALRHSGSPKLLGPGTLD